MYANNFPLLGSYAYEAYKLSEKNGQTIFNAATVFGWDGYHTWLGTDKLLERWVQAEGLITNLFQYHHSLIFNFIKALNLDTSTNEYSIHNVEIATNLLNHFILKPGAFTTEEIQIAAAIFAGSFPQEEFDLGYWSWTYQGATDQIKELLIYIIRLPEYQLF